MHNWGMDQPVMCKNLASVELPTAKRPQLPRNSLNPDVLRPTNRSENRELSGIFGRSRAGYIPSTVFVVGALFWTIMEEN
jgi:hypothetical protein